MPGFVDAKGFCKLLTSLGILHSEADAAFRALDDGRGVLTSHKWQRFVKRGERVLEEPLQRPFDPNNVAGLAGPGDLHPIVPGPIQQPSDPLPFCAG